MQKYRFVIEQPDGQIILLSEATGFEKHDKPWQPWFDVIENNPHIDSERTVDIGGGASLHVIAYKAHQPQQSAGGVAVDRSAPTSDPDADPREQRH